MSERRCTWCGELLTATARRDAKTCSKRCRQAAHRFRVGRPPAEVVDRPRRFGYADPPYPGLARRYYGCPEVDHRALVERLVREFPDGWALSTSAAALQSVLALCPPGARVCPWVKGARGGRTRRARNGWEPVIVFGGRPRREPLAHDLVDVLVFGGRQRSHPRALIGMKPAAFCEWVFRLLGATEHDELVDLFPGSGAVGRAWDLYVSRPPAAATLPSRLAGATRQLEQTCRHLGGATRRGELPATRRSRPSPTLPEAG